MRLLPALSLGLLVAAAVSADPAHPFTFVHDVAPVLTKTGCIAGVCHATAGTDKTACASTDGDARTLSNERLAPCP